MKRKLYLLRHSYAEPPGGVPDVERVLTMEGISAARVLGRKFHQDKINPSKIITSTAVRAQETAMNLCEELGISEKMIQQMEKMYEASVRELLEVINQIHTENKSALLIGHNPSMSYLAELLTASGIDNMEPCGMVTIGFDKLKWDEVSQGSGTFESYYHPNH